MLMLDSYFVSSNVSAYMSSYIKGDQMRDGRQAQAAYDIVRVKNCIGSYPSPCVPWESVFDVRLFC